MQAGSDLSGRLGALIGVFAEWTELTGKPSGGWRRPNELGRDSDELTSEDGMQNVKERRMSAVTELLERTSQWTQRGV